ncbi:MAG: hypothetical protein C4539_12270 [Ignavibacteriales bacterium]|nr:MAG: hypothetical protein C4539_12270 [Ignavibacteriales bacterium]
MNKQELIQKITEKLGAEERENKIAFEIFIDKITNYIDENSTIRITDVGIFQLKKYLKRHADKDNPVDKNQVHYYLLAVPFSFIDEASEIISFNVTGVKVEKDINKSPFSFSIDKPIIPLKTVNKKDLLIQSSYIRLQRKFENEVDKLLESTVYLDDFTIDFKPTELELIEIDVDSSDEMLYGKKYNDSGPGSIPWDFGFTEDETENKNDEDVESDKKDFGKKTGNILDQFNIRKQTEFIDKIDLSSDEVVEKEEETKVELDIDALYVKDEKPETGISNETLQNETDNDIEIKNFSMNHFTGSAPTVETEEPEDVLIEKNESFVSKPVEEVVEKESSNTLFWVLISIIIVITSASLYYYFFIVKNAENNSGEETVQQYNKSFQPPVTVDSTYSGNDTLKKVETIPTQTNVAEVQTDSLIRTDNKLKHVGGNFYTDGNTFTYQVSSWKSRSTAEKDAKRLRALGFDAYLTIQNPQSVSPWYLVRVGNYSSLQEARNEVINIK